jgi:ABC-2 type transport system ATP-binding protein
MADRIGVINKGEIILVEEKTELMRKLGKKQLKLYLQGKVTEIPASLASSYNLALAADGHQLIYSYDTKSERTGITSLLRRSPRIRHPLLRSRHHAELARRHLRQPGEEVT